MTSHRRFLFAGLLACTAPLLCHAQPTYPDTEADKHVGEEATITGKLVTIYKSPKGTTYLNIGAKYPKQTFSGVIFARDEEKVGDLKQYDGKQVALTGTIELSQDQKPQVIIKSAGQIKLAEPGAPAAPAPPPAATPKPAPTTPMPSASVAPPPAPPLPATPSPKPAETKKIALAANWSSPTQGSEMIRKDLSMLFAGQGAASENIDGDTSIAIYQDIPFLSPLAPVKKHLNLEGAAAVTTKVTCPGLPLASFSAHGFSGVFEGGFNRLYLVTDLNDQVVSVFLVDENSRQRTTELTDNFGYHTYNFISGRVKGTNDLVIKHAVTPGSRGVVVVDTTLVNPKDTENPPPKSSSSKSKYSSYQPRAPRSGKVMERSRWFVPVPIVSLILRCVGNR